MRNNYTVKKLFEDICQLEVKHNLFEKQIDGIYFWKLIRFSLFMELAETLGLYEAGHPGTMITQGNNLFRKLRDLFIGTFKGPLRDHKQFDTLLFSHPRKVMMDGILVDIYSHNKENEWMKTNHNYAVVEQPFAGKYLCDTSANVYWYQPKALQNISSYIRRNKDYSQELECVLPQVKSIANIPINEIETFSTERLNFFINDFKKLYKYCFKILKYHKPKQIYVVVAYGMAPLVSAAQDLGIKVIEIQHGTITAYHIGYSYPQNILIPYFPDEIEMWGKFWFDVSLLPLLEENISYKGFQYLQSQIAKYTKEIRNKSRVLVISQATIAHHMIPLIIEYAKINPSSEVVYRLHPSEVSVWKKIYPKLAEANTVLENLMVETHKTMPLYKSFSMSQHVVGVSSTALIESIASGCQLILINLPGVEYFQEMVRNKMVRKVSTVEELEEAVKSGLEKIIDSSYFFGRTL